MNRVDRKVALPHLIIYSDDRLLLVSSWHLTHACPHFFVYYDKCVWDSGVYADLYNLLSVGTCIRPSLFSSYWLDSLMSNGLESVDPLWHDHCEPLHSFHKLSPCWCILWLHAWYGVDIISSSSLFFLGVLFLPPQCMMPAMILERRNVAKASMIEALTPSDARKAIAKTLHIQTMSLNLLACNNL